MTLIFLSLKVRMQLHVSVWWDSLSSFLKQKKPGATVTVAGLGKESISDQNYICKNEGKDVLEIGIDKGLLSNNSIQVKLINFT